MRATHNIVFFTISPVTNPPAVAILLSCRSPPTETGREALSSGITLLVSRVSEDSASRRDVDKAHCRAPRPCRCWSRRTDLAHPNCRSRAPGLVVLRPETLEVKASAASRRRIRPRPDAGRNRDARDQSISAALTTWAVAPPADSRAHLFAASSRASWCRRPQTIAETRAPTVRRPSPKRRVVQPGLSRRIGAGQTMGDAIL